MINSDILDLRDRVINVREELSVGIEAIKLQGKWNGAYIEDDELAQMTVARAHLRIVEALLHQACGTLV